MRKELRHLIQSFWAGKVNPSEAKELLEQTAEQRDSIRERLEQEFRDENDRLLTAGQSDEIFGRIVQKAGIQQRTRKIYTYRWTAAAAAILLLGLITILHRYDRPDNYPAYASEDAAAEQRIEKISSGNERLVYTMKDGSQVQLSPHSELVVDEQYGVSNRRIRLIGEAQFAVERDTLLPFEVTANGFTTVALGTTFIVDGRDPVGTRVELISGSVVIRSTTESPMVIEDTYLSPGEMLYIDEHKRTAHVQLKKPTSVTGAIAQQKSGYRTKNQTASKKLHFEKETLQNVVERLSGQYGTAIRLADNVPTSLTFTGEFSSTDDLPFVLQTICLVNDLVFDQQDGEIILRMHPPERSPLPSGGPH